MPFTLNKFTNFEVIASDSNTITGTWHRGEEAKSGASMINFIQVGIL